MAQVKLYNKSKRTFFGEHPDALDAKGDPKPYAFKPDTAAAFDEAEAHRLRRLYPHEIQSLDDIKQQFDEKPLETAEAEEAPKKKAK